MSQQHNPTLEINQQFNFTLENNQQRTPMHLLYPPTNSHKHKRLPPSLPYRTWPVLSVLPNYPARSLLTKQPFSTFSEPVQSEPVQIYVPIKCNA